jgi:hypothetical protein
MIGISPFQDTEKIETKVVGVELRQETVKELKQGEELSLIRDPNHPLTPYYIGVFRKDGENVGYIDQKVARQTMLAVEMDHGCETVAEVVEIAKKAGIYECVIAITVGEEDYETGKWFSKMNVEVKEMIRRARSFEENDPDRAVSLYQKAMKIIEEMDRKGKKMGKNITRITSWRHEPYPINRLTLILEKANKYKDCLKEVEKFERLDDMCGLSRSDSESLLKRKVRILKKLK